MYSSAPAFVTREVFVGDGPRQEITGRTRHLHQIHYAGGGMQQGLEYAETLDIPFVFSSNGAPDAIPRLRRFILDLAVQGKLSEQDPRDEPATQLLMRIQTEMARLVKEGKIRKQNPQAEIETDAIPFTLPEGWAWARLGNLIHLLSGQHLQPGEYSDEKRNRPPYITGPADFGQNGLLITRYAVGRKAVAKKDRYC